MHIFKSLIRKSFLFPSCPLPFFPAFFLSAVFKLFLRQPLHRFTFLLLFFLLLGCAAARVICGVKKGRCAFRYQGKMEGEIDTDDLIRFMNTHLSYLQPYFHEWGYIKREALSVRGAVQEAAADAIRASTQEIGICTPFGEEQRRMAVLIIRADPTDRDSGKKEYFTDAENRLEGASFLSHDMGFQMYKCVVKAAPILQVAMEYYFNHYQRN